MRKRNNLKLVIFSDVERRHPEQSEGGLKQAVAIGWEQKSKALSARRLGPGAAARPGGLEHRAMKNLVLLLARRANASHSAAQQHGYA
jgi:hypothetical protein